MKTIALIIVDQKQGRLGHTAALGDKLAGRTVLEHTIVRAARIEGIDKIVLLKRGTQPAPALDQQAQRCADEFGIAVEVTQAETSPKDAAAYEVIASARKWSTTAWRGGIAGMSVYDELLPAGPLLAALIHHDADSAVVVRGDWCCFDPALASEQLRVHATAPEAMKIVFTQAPPGVSALIISRAVLEEMDQHGATVAQTLAYSPQRPMLDPISRDVNIAVPAEVRGQARRFIYDTPRAKVHLTQVADKLGDAFADADALTLTNTSREIETHGVQAALNHLPPCWTLELTPCRTATGPITPQHHLAPAPGSGHKTPAAIQRSAMDTPLALDIVRQLGQQGDASVLLGGLGDALLHPDWQAIASAAREAGVMGVGIETDLLVDDATLDQIVETDLDVISVRINADSAAVYEQLMGVDGYKRVLDNLQTLFNARQKNRDTGIGFRGWIVPRLTKVNENLADMETFFERWMTLAGWAVIDRAHTGMGLIPDQSPVPMDPPRKAPKPNQQKRNLTVLSDGTVTLCAQDWLGRLPLGDANRRTLLELWQDAPLLADRLNGFDEAGRPICHRCQGWLAVQPQVLAAST